MKDCSILPRASDRDIYYSIFQSLPYGKLKIALAEQFLFELPPEKFTIYPNYPNPFNPITTIRYDIPVKGDIVIQIFNLMGQQIEEYSEIDLVPGQHSFRWKASSYPSGIYFYKVYYNNILYEHNRMIYLK